MKISLYTGSGFHLRQRRIQGGWQKGQLPPPSLCQNLETSRQAILMCLSCDQQNNKLIAVMVSNIGPPFSKSWIRHCKGGVWIFCAPPPPGSHRICLRNEITCLWLSGYIDCIRTEFLAAPPFCRIAVIAPSYTFKKKKK